MAKTDAQLRNEAFVANLTAQVEAAVEQELSETEIWDLRDFYNRLEELPEDMVITAENGDNVDNCLHSYRGYYQYPSIGSRSLNKPVTASELMEEVASVASGEEILEGYKGGDYEMNWRSSLFYSNYGECSDLGVCGISDEGVLLSFETDD